MNKKLFLIPIMFFIIALSVHALPVDIQILNPGSSPEGYYLTGGYGALSPTATPNTITYEAGTEIYGQPLVIGTLTKKFVIIQDGTLLKILKLDTNLNIVLSASVDIGANSNHKIAPGAVLLNSTSIAILSLSNNNLSKYVFDIPGEALTIDYTTVFSDDGNQYPIIMSCSTSGSFLSHDYYCIFTDKKQGISATTKKVVAFGMINNTLSQANISIGTSMVMNDGAVYGDNYTFAHYYTYGGTTGAILSMGTPYQSSLRYIAINKLAIAANGNISATKIYDADLGANAGTTIPTDVIVADVDGSGQPQITFAYMFDTQHFRARTINLGGTVTGNYFTVNYPTGNKLYRNMALFPGCFKGTNYEVAFAISNTANETIISCVTQYGGVDYDYLTLTTPENIGTNVYDHYFYIAKIGLDTAIYNIITGMAWYNNVSSQNVLYASVLRKIIPVDLESKGIIELLGYKGDRLVYITSGTVNDAPVITSFLHWTTNPLCNNTLERYDVTVTDAENSDLTCNLNIARSNGTTIYDANKSATSGVMTTFNYRYTEIDTFTLTLTCYDDRNNNDVETYTAMTSTGACDTIGSVGVNSAITPEEQAVLDADVEFTTKINSALDDVGMNSGIAKTLFALLIILGGIVIVYMKTTNQFIAGGAGIILLLICFYLELIGFVPILIIGLAMATLTSYFIFAR